MQLGTPKRVLFDALHTCQINGRNARHGKSAGSDLADPLRHRVLTAQTGRIAYERRFGRVEQNAFLNRKCCVARANAEGDQIARAQEGRAIQFRKPCRKLKPLQLEAVFECLPANAHQLAVVTKGNVGEANVIGKSSRANGYNRIRNIDMQQVIACRKGSVLNVFQLFWQNDLAQTGLTGKSPRADARNDLAVDPIRNHDIAAVPRVGTDLDRAVLQLHVGKGNTVILIDPAGIECQIRGEFVTVPVVFFGTLRVIIPAVKHGIQTLRLGYALQRMIADENLLDVLQLVRHHVKGDLSLLLQDHGTDVDRAVTVIPIMAQLAKIIAGGIDQLPNLPIFSELVLRAQKGDRAGSRRTGQGRAVHCAVLAAQQRRVRRSRSNEIHVFTVVGIPCQLPGIGAQCTNAQHVFIGSRIGKCSRCFISCCGDAENITVCSQLRGLSIRISGATEGHIHHRNVALNGIIEAEDQVGGALERAIFITLGLDDKQTDLRCNANDVAAIHGRSDHAGNGCSVSLLVLDQRPIVGAVRQKIILDDLVLGCIIGILADPPGKLRMVGVNARIDYGNGQTASLSLIPDVPQIEIIQIGLEGIGGIGNRVLRAGGNMLAVLLCSVLLHQ